MRAAKQFALDLESGGKLRQVARIRVDLYGSLALTGKGHATDRAILLGLTGETPDEIDPGTIESKVHEIRERGALRLLGIQEIKFEEGSDLLFHKAEAMPGHSNTVRFTALDASGSETTSAVFYSVGGGFIAREGEDAGRLALPVSP